MKTGKETKPADVRLCVSYSKKKCSKKMNYIKPAFDCKQSILLLAPIVEQHNLISVTGSTKHLQQFLTCVYIYIYILI